MRTRFEHIVISCEIIICYRVLLLCGFVIEGERCSMESPMGSNESTPRPVCPEQLFPSEWQVFEFLAVQDGARFSRPKSTLFVTWAATISPSPTPRRSLMPAERTDQGSAKPFLGMQAPTLTAQDPTALCPVAPITFAETGLRMP